MNAPPCRQSLHQKTLWATRKDGLLQQSGYNAVAGVEVPCRTQADPKCQAQYPRAHSCREVIQREWARCHYRRVAPYPSAGIQPGPRAWLAAVNALTHNNTRRRTGGQKHDSLPRAFSLIKPKRGGTATSKDSERNTQKKEKKYVKGEKEKWWGHRCQEELISIQLISATTLVIKP